jgi:FkbM family methyltransferase
MLANLSKRVLHRFARRKYAPTIEVHRSSGLLKLGSDYGGWTFEPSSDLHGSVIVSCGLGEDASFDVEFASRYGAKVIVVDPTPRAICHFQSIQERIGQPALQRYVYGGQLHVESYDLRKVHKESLILERSALWIENTTLKFFAPPNPNHVSHSLVNLQNSNDLNTRHIEVPGIALETLLTKHQIESLPLMKLDIEGAEMRVIRNLLEKSILVRQLLVEFDEMNFPSDRSKKNVEDIDRLLRESGYTCRYFDGLSNFLYVLL